MDNRADDNLIVASRRLVFRGIEYVVTLVVNKEENQFSLEVEDRLTADQWRGQFDAKYIEDLTHKTGNFKQFSIFVNMLESALTKGSHAVMLDLLTYSDLEVLRNKRTQKPGSGTQHIPPAKTNSNLHSKRYLILTYSVEFDRIHYPLPLPYVGKPDPVQLQETIRRLNEENKALRDQLMKNSRNGVNLHLQKEVEKAITERDEIQAQFEIFKREIKHAEKANTAKEIRVLKKVVQNLESDLMKEKSKYQRTLNKKTQEYRGVVDELEEVRASERNLRARCRSLTNELAVYKRGSRASPASSSISIKRSASRNSQSRDRRSTSRDRRSTSRDPRSTSRDRLSDVQNRRSTSLERRSASRDRITSTRRRIPSPAGPRPPRFDPTAYVKEKQRKITEAEEMRGRNVHFDGRRRTRSNGSLTRGRSRSLSTERTSRLVPSVDKGLKKGLQRTSSIGSLGSRRSSQSSIDGALSDHSNSSKRKRTTKTKKKQQPSGKENRKTHVLSSPEASDVGSYKDLRITNALYSSTPENGRTHSRTKTKHRHTKSSRLPPHEIEDSFNRSAEMMEIDARLNALQHFMKANLQ